MLIRSSARRLERSRIPAGPLRIREDVAAELGVVALYAWTPENAGHDLTRRNPDLTFLGDVAMGRGDEAAGLDCTASGTSGARLLFSTGSPLNFTGDASVIGHTVFCRLLRIGSPADNANLFGIARANVANPFLVNAFGGDSISPDRAKFWRNSAGAFQSLSTAGALSGDRANSIVQSINFGVNCVAYADGRELTSTTSNVAAPTFTGTDDILAFGHDGVNNRASASIFYLGGVANRAWTADDAASFEADPYRLVESQRTFVSMMLPSGAPTTAPLIAVTGNSNAITDGDATPSATDHTDFGTITEGGSTVARTFVVTNPGDADLLISGTTIPTGFTVLTSLPGTIAPGVPWPLVIELNNTPVGTKSGDVVITHNAVGSPFNFAITGTVSAAPPPPPPPPPPSGGVRTSRTDAVRGTVFGLVVS
jgi:hypothetical protein